MALTSVLKNYIAKQYNEKIEKVEKEKVEAVDKAMKKYLDDDVVKGNAICKTLFEQIQAVKEELKEAGLGTGQLSYVNKTRDMFGTSSFTMNARQVVVKPFDNRIEALNKEKDRLLIKLSLESDFEKINELLREYNIEL
jgi:predicted RNase H-like nuclease (RuvC/YqgF family)